MLKVPFGSSTGILAIVTVLGSITVIAFWPIFWIRGASKNE
jgi:hypothetical protein